MSSGLEPWAGDIDNGPIASSCTIAAQLALIPAWVAYFLILTTMIYPCMSGTHVHHCIPRACGLVLLAVSASPVLWLAHCLPDWAAAVARASRESLSAPPALTLAWYVTLFVDALYGLQLLFRRPRCPRRCSTVSSTH